MQPTIRLATPSDAQAMHAVYHRSRPNWPIALDRMVARIANPKMLALVASNDDNIAGYAAANALADGSAVFTNVYVDPVHQGRGVGSLLWRTVEREASRLGPPRARGYVQDDDKRSITVVEHWGFRLVDPEAYGPSEDTYVLDLPASAATPTSPVDDVTFQSFAELDRADLARDLWPLYASGVRDKPRWEDDDPTIDAWHERLADDALLSDVSLVAMRKGRAVGLTVVTVLGPATAHVDFTVVDPGERGRGIATALKSESIRRATEAGYERIITESRSDNAPIIAVNERLGFRPVQLLQVERDLSG